MYLLHAQKLIKKGLSKCNGMSKAFNETFDIYMSYERIENLLFGLATRR